MHELNLSIVGYSPVGGFFCCIDECLGFIMLGKVKVKLSLCLSTKPWKCIHAFLTSSLVGGEWWTSCPRRKRSQYTLDRRLCVWGNHNYMVIL